MYEFNDHVNACPALSAVAFYYRRVLKHEVEVNTYSRRNRTCIFYVTQIVIRVLQVYTNCVMQVLFVRVCFILIKIECIY